jgi:hypothetical protein
LYPKSNQPNDRTQKAKTQQGGIEGIMEMGKSNGKERTYNLSFMLAQ